MFQLDLPLSVTFYRWLLGEESTLSLPDLAHIVPDVHRTLLKLQAVIRQKQQIEADMSLTSEDRNDKVSFSMKDCNLLSVVEVIMYFKFIFELCFFNV